MGSGLDELVAGAEAGDDLGDSSVCFYVAVVVGHDAVDVRDAVVGEVVGGSAQEPTGGGAAFVGWISESADGCRRWRVSGRIRTRSGPASWRRWSDPDGYSSHSLRAGFVTEARARGVPDELIARHTRHTRPGQRAAASSTSTTAPRPLRTPCTPIRLVVNTPRGISSRRNSAAIDLVVGDGPSGWCPGGTGIVRLSCTASAGQHVRSDRFELLGQRR